MALTEGTDRAIAWTQRHPWGWLGLYLAVSAALYQLAIRAPLYSPFMVQPTAIDLAIPPIPWTAYLYVTYFALMPSFVWLVRRHPERGRVLVTAGLCVFGNLLLNNLFPTEIATPLTPDAAGGGLLSQVIAGDEPRAALPSGHVALPLMLSILAVRHAVDTWWLYPIWTLVMSIVVLTTKQHYLPDVIAGLAWGAVAPWLAARLLTPSHPPT